MLTNAASPTRLAPICLSSPFHTKMGTRCTTIPEKTASLSPVATAMSQKAGVRSASLTPKDSSDAAALGPPGRC